MYIKICNQIFDTNEINSITITETKVLIDTKEEFYNLRWCNEEEITEARNYLKLQQLTKTELLNAVNIIIIVCNYFLSTKEQCEPCPLKKKNGCVFTTIPNEWRET